MNASTQFSWRELQDHNSDTAAQAVGQEGGVTNLVFMHPA